MPNQPGKLSGLAADGPPTVFEWAYRPAWVLFVVLRSGSVECRRHKTLQSLIDDFRQHSDEWQGAFPVQGTPGEILRHASSPALLWLKEPGGSVHQLFDSCLDPAQAVSSPWLRGSIDLPDRQRSDEDYPSPWFAPPAASPAASPPGPPGGGVEIPQVSEESLAAEGMDAVESLGSSGMGGNVSPPDSGNDPLEGDEEPDVGV